MKGPEMENEGGDATRSGDEQEVDALKTLKHESRMVGVDVGVLIWLGRV